jgi:hypothetical protein
MSNLVDDVAGYLKDKRDHLDDLYQWQFVARIPEERFGINISGKNAWQRTLSLREELRGFLGEKKDQKSREGVAQYLIRDWGGIRRFTKYKEVVIQFENLAGTQDIPSQTPLEFDGVSSWSKWASLVCPAWACIYDARVAYSLNAINFLSGGNHKIFPSPEGRNSRLKLLDAATLLLARRLSWAAGAGLNKALERDDHVIPKSAAYREYLKLVRAVSSKLWNDTQHIQTVEMLLFAIADCGLYDDLIIRLSDGA